MANSKVIDGENQGQPGEKRKNYKPLTPKQEKFCQGLVMGMSQVEAYKTAYDTTTPNAGSLETSAQSIASDPRITLRFR